MLGSTSLTQILGAAPDNTDHPAVRAYIKELCAHGLSVLLCYPHSKRPFDGRTVRARNADDKAAAKAAQDAGRRDWSKVKSPSGLALASTDSKVLLKKNGYLDEYIRLLGDNVAINLAIEVGNSGLIVIDCDTPEQLAGFYEACGIEDIETAPPPTVVSPGTQLDGQWIHHGGGHFYFTHAIDLPTNMGSLTWGGEDGFAILWDRRYVMIPPSTRKEGAYELVGQEYPAPDWLVPAITERAAAKQSRFVNNNVGPEDDLGREINEWAESVSWASILEPLGWVQTGRPDQCGCDVWTAPGEHSSPKSATTHDPGCSLGRYTETNAPMKIWTDNPGEPFSGYIEESGHTTMSKLQAVAWSSYEGSQSAAMDALGLGSSGGTELDKAMGLDQHAVEREVGVGHDMTEDIPITVDEYIDVAQPTGFIDKALADNVDNTCPGCAEPPCDLHPDTPFEEPESDIFDTGVAGLPVIAPFSHWRDMPPPEYIVDGLLEHGGLSCVIGAPGVGKSNVVLDMAMCVATGRPWQGRKTLQTRVLYLPGEGLSGTVQRMKAWCHVHDMPSEVIDSHFRLGNDILRVSAATEHWGLFANYVIRQRIGLIIFDTFARMATGVDENSATEVGRAVVRFDQIRKLTSSGVVLVHHTAKNNPTSGRGSSALNGALDSELLVRDASWEFEEHELTDGRPPAGRPIEVTTTKQKNAEMLEDPIALLMRSNDQYDAPYITGRNGEIDPMIGTVLLARPRPEPTLETAIRVREHLAQFSDLTLTRADIIAGVRPDSYTLSRVDAAKAWKQSVMLAIDLGMRYGLIDYQTDSTTRFVVGPETIENARTAHTAAVLTDEEL